MSLLKSLISKFRFKRRSLRVHLGYWTTKEGEKIRIKNLEDKHLLNIIRMFMRRNPWLLHSSYEHFSKHHPVYKKMYDEACSRGLSTKVYLMKSMVYYENFEIIEPPEFGVTFGVTNW